MNYCLRCNKPCSDPGPPNSEPSVFCDECRSLLHNRLQTGDKTEAPKDFDLLYTSLWQEEDQIPPQQSASGRNPTPNAESASENKQTYSTFANWRSQEAFTVKPLSESSPEAALSAHTHLTALQSPDSNVQLESLSQVSSVPGAKQDTPLDRPGAWFEREEDSRKSNGWTNQADPLTPRLDTYTYKFPSAPVEKEDNGGRIGKVTNTLSPTVQRRATHPYIRIALIASAALLVLALAVSGVIASMGILQTRQPGVQRSTPPAPVLPAATGTAQPPLVTVQATPSASPSVRVGHPTATTSSIPGSPGSGAPTLSSSVERVSPSTLTFNATQGKANPSGQVIEIANTGRSPLNWTASVDSSWLSAAPGKGTVANGQTAQVTVHVNTAGLTPGSFNAKITISATGSSATQVQGSPQIVSVTLTVAQPCTLQVSPSSLSFTASVLLGSNPRGQNITLTETGNCTFPVSWKASTDHAWIILSATSGTDSSKGSTITVNVKGSGLTLGQYTGQITISAVDSGGAPVQGSPQTVSITLTVSLT